jgi:hypothetical protein
MPSRHTLRRLRLFIASADYSFTPAVVIIAVVALVFLLFGQF